jgi:hypothetical protein
MLDAKERLQRLTKHLFCKSKTCQLLHRLQKVGPWITVCTKATIGGASDMHLALDMLLGPAFCEMICS